MKLPADALIAPEKLTRYLLRWRPENADRLRHDIQTQLLPLDAEFLEPTEYGPKYRIRGSFRGRIG